MDTEDIDLQQITDILGEKGLRTEKFTKDEKHQSKTPDFRVFKGNKLVFFCEVKTVSRDQWLDQQIKAAPPLTIVGNAREDPVFNRLSKKIHEAAQQFDAVNPDLEYPNVLAFLNYDNSCNISYLFNVISGYFFAEGGKKYPIYSRFSGGRIREEKFRIHLYIWIDKSEDEFKNESYHFNMLAKEHLSNLCSYFSIDPDSIKNIGEER